ncbi:YceI family protein [Streptomyces sp. SL13]|jgi:polyisoprenoid-binding protein YceI|uniref:YceI family protein n=1 Tax=Streptantibioticus silvisoli TaxID=2705255 RepID=A0AA90H591_9ACTN|nr:YceI family protein [Streptantibioticus silvisoli]MDI5965688.1 YceI family protein [Streptantibioticus silvisoli]MDI5971491.1 YceI family protein [Streptantibioticus silvisoli]
MSDGGLRARVRTKDGWAVHHAALTVTDMTGSQIVRALADEAGMVRTDPLPAGTYTVIVTAVGYQPTASTAIVGASGRADLGNVTLSRQGGAELPPPGRWTIDPAHSTVGAVAQHLGISSIRGHFSEFSGQIRIAARVEESTVTATLSAGSIDTGNKQRDDHLRSADFLDIETYPEITYRSTGGLTPAGPDRWTVHGELSMRDHVRAVDLDLTYLGTGADPWGGTRAAFRGVAELRREDFALNYNQMLQAGIAMIGTTMRVELDIQAVRGDVLPTA